MQTMKMLCAVSSHLPGRDYVDEVLEMAHGRGAVRYRQPFGDLAGSFWMFTQPHSA